MQTLSLFCKEKVFVFHKHFYKVFLQRGEKVNKIPILNIF